MNVRLCVRLCVVSFPSNRRGQWKSSTIKNGVLFNILSMPDDHISTLTWRSSQVTATIDRFAGVFYMRVSYGLEVMCVWIINIILFCFCFIHLVLVPIHNTTSSHKHIFTYMGDVHWLSSVKADWLAMGSMFFNHNICSSQPLITFI